MDVSKAMRVAGLALLLFVFGWAVAAADDGTCAQCHGDKARLESLSDRGEDLYVDLEKAAQDFHARFDCTDCHGGDSTIDSVAACKGIAYPNPAAPAVMDKTCGQCHKEITEKYTTSLHISAAGIKNSLVNLMGVESGSAKFEATCNKCHATCASCHMEQPDRRGIMHAQVESHNFVASPKSDNCTACHGAMGDTFYGMPDDPEHGASAMATAGMECMDCHTEANVHGSGVQWQYVSEATQPVCQKCHENPQQPIQSGNIPAAPQYDAQSPAHVEHEGNLTCSACHTTWYQNCWDCHQGRQSKMNYDLSLLLNQETGEIAPAAHAPAGTDWGGVDPEAGAWAIKPRHSWGDARTCETCHASDAVYIDEVGRKAIFAAAWIEPATSGDGQRAAFVDPALVKRVVLDMDTFKQDVHGDLVCADCHDTSDDSSCADCHATAEKTGQTVLPADGDWSRTTYVRARTALDDSTALLETAKQQGMDTKAWQEQWDALHDEYLTVGNSFHGEPGPAQAKMSDLAARCEALHATIDAALNAQQANKGRLATGLPLAAGLLGTVVLGIVVVRPSKKK